MNRQDAKDAKKTGDVPVVSRRAAAAGTAHAAASGAHWQHHRDNEGPTVFSGARRGPARSHPRRLVRGRGSTAAEPAFFAVEALLGVLGVLAVQ
jgi:hypothetical protein